MADTSPRASRHSKALHASARSLADETSTPSTSTYATAAKAESYDRTPCRWVGGSLSPKSSLVESKELSYNDIMNTQINPHSQTHHLLQFKRAWVKRLNLSEDDAFQLLEDLRAFTILVQRDFRKNQKRGNFTDKTGDLSIQLQLETLHYEGDPHVR